MIPVKYVPQSCFGCFRIVGAEYTLVQLGELVLTRKVVLFGIG